MPYRCKLHLKIGNNPTLRSGVLLTEEWVIYEGKFLIINGVIC